jgi:hypothetical protein
MVVGKFKLRTVQTLRTLAAMRTCDCEPSPSILPASAFPGKKCQKAAGLFQLIAGPTSALAIKPDIRSPDHLTPLEQIRLHLIGDLGGCPAADLFHADLAQVA